MKVKVCKLTFAGMPKDYKGLCGVLLPRPIRDKVDFKNVKEAADAMAGFEDGFTEDQSDYFDLLCSLMEDYEASNPGEQNLPIVSGIDVLKHLLAERNLSGADLSRMLDGTRALGPMILRGERSLTASHVRRLSGVFGVSADVLLKE